MTKNPGEEKLSIDDAVDTIDYPSQKRSLGKAAVAGAAAGAALFPAIDIVFDKLVTSGTQILSRPNNEKLRILGRSAALGAIFNGTLNVGLAMWHNHKVEKAQKSYLERVIAERAAEESRQV